MCKGFFIHINIIILILSVLYITVVIRLKGALGYKTHPTLSNLIKLSSQTENYMKILCYKTHPNFSNNLPPKDKFFLKKPCAL